MNLPMLHMVSWGQFSGSLDFTEGWGFPPPPFSLSKQISIFFDFPCMSGQAEWADLLSAARSLGLQLLTDNSLQNPHPVHQVLLPFAYPPQGSQAEVLLEGASTLVLAPLSGFPTPVGQTQGSMIYQALGCSAGFCQMKTQKSFVS